MEYYKTHESTDYKKSWDNMNHLYKQQTPKEGHKKVEILFLYIFSIYIHILYICKLT